MATQIRCFKPSVVDLFHVNDNSIDDGQRQHRATRIVESLGHEQLKNMRGHINWEYVRIFISMFGNGDSDFETTLALTITITIAPWLPFLPSTIAQTETTVRGARSSRQCKSLNYMLQRLTRKGSINLSRRLEIETCGAVILGVANRRCDAPSPTRILSSTTPKAFSLV